MKDRVKRKKYSTGTAVNNYIDNPSTVLTENQINIAKAKYESESNPWTLALDSIGGIMMQQGLGMAGGVTGAADALGGSMKKGGGFGSKLWGKKAIAEKGGTVGGKGLVPVEVEDGEVIETPGGEAAEVNGKSHAEGGIDMDLPEGTQIFSDKLEVAGVSLADRKLKRERRIKKMMKSLEKNPSDKILKDTFDRIKEGAEKEEEGDMKLQEFASALDTLTEYAYGTSKGGLRKKQKWGNPYLDSGTSNTTDTTKEEGESTKHPWTFGDVVGGIGTAFSTLSPLLNTDRNRAGDTPNINAYEDFGQDAIAANDQAQTMVGSLADNAKRDLALNRTAAFKRNRNSARSINTSRALDLNTDIGVNKSITDIYDNWSKQVMGLLDKRSTLENTQDAYVMKGEQERDLNDRMDRDNYYTQRGADLANVGTGIQKFGSDINTHQENQDFMDMLPDISKYGLHYVRKNGKLTISDTKQGE